MNKEIKNQEEQEEESNQIIWSYSECEEEVDIEFNPAKVYFIDDELEQCNLSDEGYEEGLSVTLTRKQAKALIEDLQQWLDGE